MLCVSGFFRHVYFEKNSRESIPAVACLMASRLVVTAGLADASEFDIRMSGPNTEPEIMLRLTHKY